MTTFHPKGMYLIGNLIFDLIKELKPNGIGGLTLGADPLAIATALISHIKGQPIPAFTVRKQPKIHGTQQCVELGGLSAKKDSKIIVLDDVITTGASTITAIKKLRDSGLKLIKVVVLVDREEQNGKENIEQEGIEVCSIFTMSDILTFSSPQF